MSPCYETPPGGTYALAPLGPGGGGGGGFIDGDIPWTFIFYIVRLMGARGLRPHMTLSCHPLFASHGPKIYSTVTYMALRQVNMVPAMVMLEPSHIKKKLAFKTA